jgi:hypothetical protein
MQRSSELVVSLAGSDPSEHMMELVFGSCEKEYEQTGGAGECARLGLCRPLGFVGARFSGVGGVHLEAGAGRPRCAPSSLAQQSGMVWCGCALQVPRAPAARPWGMR